jgi:hypothetical protein
MELSQSHDLSCEFDKLIRVHLGHFFYILRVYPDLTPQITGLTG